MLDIKTLRKNPKEIEQKLQTKLADVDLSLLLEYDEALRKVIQEQEALLAKRNTLSKEIGQKKQKGEDASSLMDEVAQIGEKAKELSLEKSSFEALFHDALSSLPNLPFDDIPISPSAKDNVCIKMHGEKRSFSFPFKNHVELNENLHFFDFPRSAKISGSHWPLYIDWGAKIEWALLNFMLETHLKNGFIQIMPPLLVRSNIMYGSGQLPKFRDQLFQVKDDDFDLYVIPTAEVPLNGMHAEEMLEESALPLKYTSYTPCFRREAGAAGASERGLIRMHQFNKVELFCLCRPEESEQMFQEMLKSAEEVLQGLDLHYRAMLLTTGDMSFAAAKTVDLEVWLPGQDRYYEVSSISNCTDFQSRRSEIRYRRKGEKPEYVHTLNGSGLATSRLLVALMENSQQEDGSFLVPKALQRYLGKERLDAKKQ